MTHLINFVTLLESNCQTGVINENLHGKRVAFKELLNAASES